MNILITGSSGFIGFSLSKYILELSNKHKIYGIDSLNSYYSQKLKRKRTNILKKYKNFKFKKLDISNKSKINNYLKRIKLDLVINFAAQAGVRYSLSNPEEYVYSNQLGFFNILDYCRKYDVKLIYASSSSVYGDANKFPTKEKNELNPKNIYSATKLGNEIFAEIFFKFYKLKIIGLRFFTVYGEWGRPDMFILKYLETAHKKKKFIYYNKGNYVRDFTYIHDVIKLIHPLIFSKKKVFEKHEIYNVCSNKPIKISKVYKKLNKIIKNKNLLNIKKNKLDSYKTHGSNKKILSLSKLFKFTKFDDALLETYEWYKKFAHLI